MRLRSSVISVVSVATVALVLASPYREADLQSPEVAGSEIVLTSGGSDLPDWYENARLMGVGPGNVNSSQVPQGNPVWDRMAEGFAGMGANAFYRHIDVSSEDPWWPSAAPMVGGNEIFDRDRYNAIKRTGGQASFTFVPEGTNQIEDMVAEADANGQSLVAYFRHQVDRTVAELHPEWVCHNVDGTIPQGGGQNIPFFLDISEHAGYRDVVLQRLLELAEAGVDGFFFDYFQMPRDGCFDTPIADAFETANGSVPATTDESDATFRKWLDFHADAIADTVAYWTDQVHAQYPDVVLMPKGAWLAGLTNRRDSTDQARASDVVSIEWHDPDKPLLHHSVFNNPLLAKPERSMWQAFSFSLVRDSADGRPPHIWGSWFPNEDHMLLFVSSITTFGGVASPTTGTEDLLEDDGPAFHTDFGYYTPRPVLEAGYHLSDRISPYLANTRPERFAAVHFCEACRNARDDDFDLAWREVLWPAVGAFGMLAQAGVPVGTIDDYQLANGGLDEYELLFVADRDFTVLSQEDPTLAQQLEDQVDAFETAGGTVIENQASWEWDDPEGTDDAFAAFLAAVSSHLDDAQVRVTGGPERTYSTAFTLPDGATGTDRLVVAVSNDFEDLEMADKEVRDNNKWGTIPAIPPPVDDAVVEWDEGVGVDELATLRAFDAVSGEELTIQSITGGYKVELPEFEHMALLVVEEDTTPPADTEAPRVWNTIPGTWSTNAGPDPVQTGTPVELAALVDDFTRGGSSITSASYTIDGGTPVAMSATDGTFDQSAEHVEATIPAFGSEGTYEICVTGVDAESHVSDPDCAYVRVDDTAPVVAADVVAVPNPLQIGVEVQLRALVEDADGGPLGGASYAIDGGADIDMAPVDGALTSSLDQMIATLPAFGSAGEYEVCVTGMDMAGNTGAPECTTITVETTTAADPQTLEASDAAADDRFGTAVSSSADGATVLVGAPGRADDTGAVYAYGEDGSLVEQDILLAADGAAGDEFGHSVAVSADGETAVVGAPYDADNGSLSGSAYVFARQPDDTWVPIDKIVAAGVSAGDRFAEAVAIDADGDTIVVGSRLGDDAVTNAGAAYVFTRNIDDTWTHQETVVAANPANLDHFGRSVTINGAGDLIAVGANGHDGFTVANVGAVYTFTRNGDESWSPQDEVLSEDSEEDDDQFGWSVALSADGGTLAVGATQDDEASNNAGAVFVFTEDGGTWSQHAKLMPPDPGPSGPQHGWSVAISGDGSTVVEGTYRETGGLGFRDGAVLAFAMGSDGSWARQTRIDNEAADSGEDEFGHAVALTADGSNVVTGARLDDTVAGGADAGSAHVLPEILGPEVRDVVADPVTVVVGDPVDLTAVIDDTATGGSTVSAVYRVGAGLPVVMDAVDGDFDSATESVEANVPPFDSPGEREICIQGADAAGNVTTPESCVTLIVESQLAPGDLGADDEFGTGVAAAGGTTVVGAQWHDSEGVNAGAAYVYADAGGAPMFEAKLVADDAVQADRFGTSAAVSADGNTVVVGARGVKVSGEANAGAAYVFTRTGETWSQEAKLVADDPDEFDSFGVSVGIAGDTIVVGAQSDDEAGNNDGAVYIFARDGGGTWSQQAKLMSDVTASSDQLYLGSSVSIAVDGETVVAGAPFENQVGAANAGAAYVFEYDSSSWTQDDKLVAGNASAEDNFGTSVSISADGVVVAAGAPGDDSGAGAAYLFERSLGSSSWSDLDKLVAQDAAAGDAFGSAVAVEIDGESLVVGAPLDDHVAGSDAGSTYVFALAVDSASPTPYVDGTWIQTDKLVAAAGAGSDMFGGAVAINNRDIVVGSLGDDHGGGSDAGSAHQYSLPNPPYDEEDISE